MKVYISIPMAGKDLAEQRDRAARLAERLTEAEKERINKLQGEIFKEIMDAHDADDWQGVAHYILDVMPRSFVDVFGADLFKET